MTWYLMKTWAGGEEALVKEIQRTVPPYLYEEVFVLYNERIWRHQGQSSIQLEPLFKGCVFLTCRETEPLFRRLEQIPAMSRLIATGALSMFPLMDRDARFLAALSSKDHVVRVSYVLREPVQSVAYSGADSEEIATYRVFGPLESLIHDIERIKFRTRTVKTHRKLWGEDMTIVLGIIANEDLEQNLRHGNLGISPELPSHYTILEIGKDAEGKNVYRAGGEVRVMAGEYEEMIKVG